MVNEVHQLINCVQRQHSTEGTQQSLPWQPHEILSYPFHVTLVWALHAGSNSSGLERIRNKTHTKTKHPLCTFWLIFECTWSNYKSSNDILLRVCHLTCSIIRGNLDPNRCGLWRLEGLGRGVKGKGVRPLNIAKAPLPTPLSTDQCKYVVWKLTQLGKKHPTGRINTQQRIMGTLCKQLWSAL